MAALLEVPDTVAVAPRAVVVLPSAPRVPAGET